MENNLNPAAASDLFRCLKSFSHRGRGRRIEINACSRERETSALFCAALLTQQFSTYPETHNRSIIKKRDGTIKPSRRWREKERGTNGESLGRFFMRNVLIVKRVFFLSLETSFTVRSQAPRPIVTIDSIV